MYYYAIVDSESLNNPTNLNKFDQVKVVIQYEPHSSASKYHHNFKLKFNDKDINQSIGKIQKEMKKGWYFFVWNTDAISIVFDSKKFELSLPIDILSRDYQLAQEFGKTQGIQDEYLDYKKYFIPFYNLEDFKV